jgi:hypothetical protein
VTRPASGGGLEGHAQVPSEGIEARDTWGALPSTFVRLYRDSQGTTANLRSAGWKGTIWMWEGEAVGADGTPVKLRETIERVDDDTMHARWEIAGDDRQWAPLSEETLHRRK